MGSAAYGRHLLYHDAVDAHVSGSPAEVEQVDPAEDETQNQKAQVFLLATPVEHKGDDAEQSLKETRGQKYDSN